MKLTKFVKIDGNSPWFSGHFPDDPVLPGIAQLKVVIDLLSSSVADNMRMSSMSRIKFRKIIRPGELLDVNVSSDTKENNFMFRITSGNEEVCSGKMSFTQIEKEERIHE